MIPILDALMPVVGKLLDFIPDPKQKAEAKQKMLEEMDRHSEELLKALSAVDQKQAEINAEEAKSSNLFIAGWRPAVAWICVASFAWAYIVQPVIVFGFTVAGRPPVGLPEINIGEMMPVLFGILGLGGLRTWEKSQGIHNEH